MSKSLRWDGAHFKPYDPAPDVRIGDWIQTFTGGQYWPADPRADEVNIEDIAHALSNLCRYGGHCREFYSVAEHSVHVSHLVSPQFQLQALLHDATEAYVVDVPRPLKRFLTNYADIEDRNWKAISQALGVPYVLHKEVKLADNRILLAEQQALMGPPPAKWAQQLGNLTMPDSRIMALAPVHAEVFFMERYKELTK